MTSIGELQAQKAEIERRIAEAQREQRATAINQIRTLMAEHNLTLADLSSKGGTTKRPGSGAKVPAKYRDRETGNTWSGRGLQPKWLRAALAGGRQLSDFDV